MLHILIGLIFRSGWFSKSYAGEHFLFAVHFRCLRPAAGLEKFYVRLKLSRHPFAFINFVLQRFDGPSQVDGLLLDFRFQSRPQPEFLLLETQTLLEQ